VITFDNKSGQHALVRLVGPTRGEANVSNGARNSIRSVAGGTYRIRVRYGTSGNYDYTEGDAFQVESSSRGHSVITITLHPVVGGTYGTSPSSASAFTAVAP